MRCLVCGAPATHVCGRCLSADYCCAEHQAMDWLARHRSECCSAGVGVELAFAKRTCIAADKKWGEARSRLLVDPRFALRDYPYVRKLGKGAYGSASLRVAKGGGPGDVLAVKQIECPDSAYLRGVVLHEFDMRNLDHPNVVGMCLAGFSAEDRALAFGMDAAAETLTKLIVEGNAESPRGPFHPLEAQMISYQLARGVAYCTSKLVIHGDIKPDNVLAFGLREPALPGYARAGNFKQVALTDFGLAKAFYTGPLAEDTQYTDWYRPPELFAPPGMRVLSDRADVWATGCCIYEVASGRTPLFMRLERKTPMIDIITRVVGKPGKPVPWWDPHRATAEPPLFDQLITHALGRAHPQLPDLLRRMLAPVPEDRISIFDVLNHPYFSTAAKARVEALLPQPAATLPLEFLAEPVLRVSPASVLTVLREKAQIERDLEMASWQARRRTGTTLRWCTARLLAHVARGLGGLRMALAGYALLRAHYFRPSSVAAADESGLKAVAAACHVLACAYRHGSAWDPNGHSVSAMVDVNGEKLAKACRDVFVALDFNVAIPSAFDFIAEHAVAHGIASEIEHRAAAVFLCRQISVFLPPDAFGTGEEEALQCMSYAAGAPPASEKWRSETVAAVKQARALLPLGAPPDMARDAFEWLKTV